MIDTLLFDVDGVMLSEERYFDVSALTVYELIYSKSYLGLNGFEMTYNLSNEHIHDIRTKVFQADEGLAYIKSFGINANWDMVYLAFAFQLILALESIKESHPDLVKKGLKEGFDISLLKKIGKAANAASFMPQFDQFVGALGSPGEEVDLFERLDAFARDRLGDPTSRFSKREPLWSIGQAAFQEFYLGSHLFEEVTKSKAIEKTKPGFLEDEIPLLPPDQLRELFHTLKSKGFKLGIGTGRPIVETEIPLKELGIWSYFEPGRIVTASDMESYEKKYPEWGPLSKPHPLTYLIGFLDGQPSVEAIYNQARPIQGAERLLIVGDSLADLLAAQAIGAQFAAVLTGLSGAEARTTFEAHQADFILNDLSELLGILN